MLAPPGKRHYTFRRCRRSGSLPPGDAVRSIRYAILVLRRYPI